MRTLPLRFPPAAVIDPQTIMPAMSLPASTMPLHALVMGPRTGRKHVGQGCAVAGALQKAPHGLPAMQLGVHVLTTYITSLPDLLVLALAMHDTLSAGKLSLWPFGDPA